MQKNNENSNLFSQEGLPVNIISMQWFNSWKNYTFFDEICEEFKQKLNSKSTLTEISDSRKTGEKFMDNNNNNYSPGYINQKDILLNENILIDPDKTKEYCNCSIRFGLQENKNFIIGFYILFFLL